MLTILANVNARSSRENITDAVIKLLIIDSSKYGKFKIPAPVK
jgi:hypothetical protein